MNFQQLYTEAKQLSSPKLRDDIVQHLYDRSQQLCDEGVSYPKSNKEFSYRKA